MEKTLILLLKIAFLIMIFLFFTIVVFKKEGAGVLLTSLGILPFFIDVLFKASDYE